MLEFSFANSYCGHQRLWCSSDAFAKRHNNIHIRVILSITRRISAGLGRSNTMAIAGKGKDSLSSHKIQRGSPACVVERTKTTSEEDALFVDYEDTDEDEALLIPRVGDLPHASIERPAPSILSRNPRGKGASFQGG